MKNRSISHTSGIGHIKWVLVEGMRFVQVLVADNREKQAERDPSSSPVGPS